MLSKNSRSGSAIAIVIVVAITVGTVALSYFRIANTVPNNKNRSSYKNLAKEIARIAINEAFNKISKDSKNPHSPIFEILKQAKIGTTNNIDLSFTNECLEKILPSGFTSNIYGKIKIVDFCKSSPKGKKYFGTNEGNGIVSIEAKALVYKNKGLDYSLVASHKIEEYHDYIIASAVSMGENGSKLLNSLIVRQNREIGEKDKIDEKGLTLKIEKSPESYQPVLPDKMTFYDEPALWHKRNLSISELKKQGYIDQSANIIELNGIIHCCDDIVLDGDWRIKGQGVIIANSFQINGGIEKLEPNAICVLYSRKRNITINTSKQINAALIAINPEYTGTIEAKKIINVNGAMVIDTIDLSSWPEGDHSITYDRIFKNDIFANRIAVSDWINYRQDDDKLPQNEI